MKTSKLKGNATPLEKHEWMVRVIKHCKNGGDVKFLNEIKKDWGFLEEPQEYEIVPEPQRVPYTDETRHKIRMDAMIKYKGKKTWWYITAMDHEGISDDGTDYTWEESFDKIEYFDGQPFGILEDDQ